MKMKRVTAGLLCLIMAITTVDMTAFASADMYTVSGNDVSGNDVSGNVVPGDVSGGDMTEEDTGKTDVSANDTENQGQDQDTTENPLPSVSDSDISGNDTEEEKPDITLPYTIDKNGVLTAWKGAEGKITIPTGVTAIGEGVFAGNTKLVTVTVSEGVTSIGKDAFKNCAGLETVRLPKSLTEIGEGAFEDCDVLYMVYLQEADYANVQNIGARAFAGCRSLAIFMDKGSFVIPDSVTTIGNNAFESCHKLKSIILPKKLGVMGTGVFTDCQALTTATLSANYKWIPVETFKGCYSLNSIVWSGVSVIEERAFENCEALTVLTIPSSVTEIRSQAFANCTELTFVVFDSKTTKLTGAVFSDDHTTTLCAESGSEAEYYAKGYSYLNFITKDKANKVSYPIDSTAITKKFAGSYVFCYVMKRSEEMDTREEVKSAKPGTEIFVEIQNLPKDYVLVEGSLKANGEALKTVSEGVYSFNQKLGGAALTAEFAQVKYTDTLGAVSYETSESIENGIKVGQTVQLYLFSSKVSLEKPLKGSRFAFKNYDSNKLAVSLDSEGRISLTGKAAGKTVLEIYNRYNDTKVAEIEIEIKKYVLNSMDLHIVDSSSHIEEAAPDEDGTRNFKVAERYVGDGLSISVKANGWDAEGTPINVAYQWSTSDSRIAKVGKTATAIGNSSNTITIPKGANGEATITVTAKDESQLKKCIHITVADGKPSFKAETTVFNSYKEKPMVLSLIESYGYAVDTASLKLYDLDETDQNISASRLFSVKADEQNPGQYVIFSRNDEDIPNGQYRVALDGETGAGHFSHKFTITVKNTLPSAKVKQTGKINLFYNVGGEAQTVETKISGYGKEKIVSYGLANLDAGSNKQLQADYDKFTENFEVDAQTGVIRRKAAALGLYETGKSKGKAVVSGYLLICFEGYREPKRVSIKVATQNKQPSYVLAEARGTYNNNRAETVSIIRLRVNEKKGKELLPVSLTDRGFEASYDFTKSTGIFQASVPTLAVEGDEIVVSVKNLNAAGKLVINLSNPTEWGKDSSVKLTYTVKITSKQPKISLSKTKIQMNPVYENQTAAFTLKANQSDCVIAEEQTFTPEGENPFGIQVTYQNGQGVVTIPKNVKVQDGTYKFTCQTKTDNEYYVNGIPTKNLNKVTLSVVIKNKVPSVKLDSGKYTLNLSVRGREEASRKITVSNAPLAGSNYEVSDIIVKSANYDVADFTCEDGLLKAKLKETGSFGTGKFVYELALVWSNGSHTVTGKSFRVTVIVQNKSISANVGSSKGKLDLLNREKTGVSFAVSVKNVNDTMTGIKVYELNAQGTPETTESSRFYGIMEKGRLMIKAYQDAPITSGKTYSLKIDYKLCTDLESDPVRTLNKTLKVKPAQAFPKLTVDKKKVGLYQSARDTYFEEVTITADKKATAKITGVEWAKGVDAKIKESFSYEVLHVDEEKNAVTIRIGLKKNYLYAVGKTQTLKFAVVCEGQDEVTYGTAFSVKATVNR